MHFILIKSCLAFQNFDLIFDFIGHSFRILISFIQKSVDNFEIVHKTCSILVLMQFPLTDVTISSILLEHVSYGKYINVSSKRCRFGSVLKNLTRKFDNDIQNTTQCQYKWTFKVRSWQSKLLIFTMHVVWRFNGSVVQWFYFIQTSQNLTITNAI